MSSLNAPSLFLIAKDLRRIQVWASVNEADIGRVHLNMPVRFNVDAYSGEVFRGKVAQIRLNAASTQNVVTYTVVVATDNADGRLLPLSDGESAIRGRAAVQRPVGAQRRAALEAAKGTRLLRGRGRRPRPARILPATKKPPATRNPPNRPRIMGIQAAFGFRSMDWFRPIEIVVGPTDGSMTEVSGKHVTEGMKVVIGESGNDDVADAETTNPFAPKMFGKKKM